MQLQTEKLNLMVESNKLVKLLHTKQTRRVVNASCLLGIALNQPQQENLSLELSVFLFAKISSLQKVATKR